MNAREASEQWNDLLERTFLLWEDCGKFRREVDAATKLRRDQYAGMPPPSVIDRLPQFADVLQTSLRNAMNDVKSYHAGGEGGPTGEHWLRRMEQRMREEEGPLP